MHYSSDWEQQQAALENVFDLTELIVGQCIGTMFEHHDIANEKLRFADFFEGSIGNVVGSSLRTVYGGIF